jgi:hypothetical protein
LKSGIRTESSKNNIGLQIADVFASAVNYALKNKNTEFSKAILKIVHDKCLCNPTYCIMPGKMRLSFICAKGQQPTIYHRQKFI